MTGVRTWRAVGVGACLAALTATSARAGCEEAVARLSPVAAAKVESACAGGDGALFVGDRISLRPAQGIAYKASMDSREFDVVCSSEQAGGLAVTVTAGAPLATLVPDGGVCAWDDLGTLACTVDGSPAWSCAAFVPATDDPDAALGAIAGASIRGSADAAYPDLFASEEVSGWRRVHRDGPALDRLLRAELLEAQPHRFAAWVWAATAAGDASPPAGVGDARQVQAALADGRLGELPGLFPAGRIKTVQDPFVLLVVAQAAVDAGQPELAVQAIARLDWQVTPDLLMSAVVLRRAFEQRADLRRRWRSQVDAEPRLQGGLVQAWLEAAEADGPVAATEAWLAARPDDPMARAWLARLADRPPPESAEAAWPFGSPLGAWEAAGP